VLLAKLERWLEPPIMRQRINKGSDWYFDWRDEHAGESALDDLFGVRPRATRTTTRVRRAQAH
jgi:hypothetical protein